jgi:RHS repeat-associated protein
MRNSSIKPIRHTAVLATALPTRQRVASEVCILVGLIVATVLGTSAINANVAPTHRETSREVVPIRVNSYASLTVAWCGKSWIIHIAVTRHVLIEYGHAQIIGAPGALAERWNAVAVRRGRDFSNRPQDTADAQRAVLIASIRDLVVTFDGSQVTVTSSLPARTRVEILNLRSGVLEVRDDFTGAIQMGAEVGDRLVFLIGEHDVDPSASAITVVFSEPVAGSREELRRKFKLLVADDPDANELTFKAVPGFDDIAVNSGGRRITLAYRGSFQRGQRYRLELSSDIKDQDEVNRLGLGQKADGEAHALHIDFTVRKPRGHMGDFDFVAEMPLDELGNPLGGVRDLAMTGNILLVSTMEGGILAYDASNPAKLAGNAVQPIMKISPPPSSRYSEIRSATWALATDNHDRIYATAVSNIYGVVRSYRVEDLYCAPRGTEKCWPDIVDPLGINPPQARTEPPIAGNNIIAWRTGINVGMPLATMMIGGWPEAMPRKMQIVTKDAEPELLTFEADPPPATPGGPIPGSVGNGFRTISISVAPAPVEYDKQRVTVTNVTRNYRWSKDIDTFGGATAFEIIGKAGDEIRIDRNLTTIGVISLFGHGVGVYDLNAVDANFRNRFNNRWKAMQDTLVLVPPAPMTVDDTDPCDKTAAAMVGGSCPISDFDLALSPDAAIVAFDSTGPSVSDLAQPNDPPCSSCAGVSVFALHQNRGMVQHNVERRDDDPDDPDDATVVRNTAGSLVFAEKVGNQWAGHPRLNKLRHLYRAATGNNPQARYTSIATYRRDAGHVYALVAGFQYGLLVARLDKNRLNRDSLVDVVWIPSGAYSVRVMQDDHLAVVVDGDGRVLLINLKQIDESDRVGLERPECTGPECEWPLFPSVEAALTPVRSGSVTTPVPVTVNQTNSGMTVGFDDPRIVWKSDPGMVIGTLAPIVDTETGFVYAGSVLGRKMDVVSAVDPRVRFVGRTGMGAAPNEMRVLDQIVPLGIKPPKGSVLGANGSLAAFRLSVVVPGSIEESLTGPLHIEIDTERAPGSPSAQTSDPLPRSRFRQTGSRSTSGFVLQHDAPQSTSDPAVANLRFQRGWNRMTTPWIVAIADPRASEKYSWPTGATIEDKEKEGCYSCNRPDDLRGQTEPEVFELYSSGRVIHATPDASSLTGDWAWLGESHRLDMRINTVHADTVRPTSVLVAAQAPPVAGGMLQETTYLHSGELETSAVDYDAGGRAGWNGVIDRTYRSRTLVETAFGTGWDSAMFRRLRPLPTGEVEYRDGGETWTFKPQGGAYTSPAGLSLKLTRIDRGWTLVDQKVRVTTFNELGILISESDEFYKPSDPASGNVIRYTYDAQGRLASIVDPTGRSTKLTYWDDSSPKAGLVREIEDWHTPARRISYDYDAERRLIKVQLPEVANTSSARPEVRYAYSSAASGYNDRIELLPNLESITDPKEAASGGTERVKFGYGSGIERDHVTTQTWATGEKATMSYPSPASAIVKDVLSQERKYALTTPPDDRAHVNDLRELAVPVWSGASFGQLPASVSAGSPATLNSDRVWTFTYLEGMQTGATLDGVSTATVGYTSAPGLAGKIVSSTTSGPASPSAKGISAQSSNPSWMSVDTPITRTFEYQSGAPTFLQAVTTGSKRIESPEAHRYNASSVAAANDSINATSQYDSNGLFKESASSGGTDTAGAGSKSKIEYYPATAPRHARFLPHYIYEGEEAARLTTEITYPSESQTVVTDPRGVVTTTDLDAWGRPTKVRVVKPSDPLALETRYEYDATGRVEKVIEKQNGADVTTTYTYDVMGRQKTATKNNIATVGSVTTTTTYDLRNRKTITTQPGGATTTTEVDSLGRPIASSLNTGSSPIEQRFAYDLAGNRVYSTDLFIASASAYDSHGRLIATRAADGTITAAEHDELGQVTEVKALDPSATETVSESSYSFSPAGRLEGMKSKVDGATERSTTMVWDGGGRTTGSATGDRASRSTYDIAGRSLSHAAGRGSASALSETFSRSEIASHDGALPATTKSQERGGPQITTTMQRDTTGGVTQANTGSLQWNQKYDELGNMTKASAPGRPSASWDVDARGTVEKETLPDGATNQFAYDGSGAQKSYSDPTSEATTTVPDLIGRPTSRIYPDGTTETITWEGSRLKSVTDRQGRTQDYVYNLKGQLEEVREGGAVLDRLTYDTAGRLSSWKTADSELTWSDFDMEGRPKRTKQRRFKDASGLTTATLLDEFEQQHAYNEHGERTFASMPIYPGLTLGSGWTKGIAEQHDAMGNVTSISRAESPTAVGAPVMTASYRNAGRPDSRTVTTAGGSTFVRTYSYDPTTSQLESLKVSNANGVFAGSEVAYDGLQKSSARMLGLSSGERYNHWKYNDRSQVEASLYGVKNANADPAASVPGRAREDLSPADFRNAQERTPQLDDGTRAVLAAKNIDTTKVDPPTSTFDEQSGHKIAQMTKGPLALPFGYNGAERVDDGRFVYTFDAKGRLISATEKATVAPIRRARYSYSGANRLVGRTAEYASVASPAPADWKIEDRPHILRADGLPAETTFVWDPITDRLVSIFKAGATATDAHGGLLKQIIHCEASYDDPCETATIDPSTGAVTQLYPIYDEAATGSLQAIVNTNGEVIARNLSKEPYGADDVALTGAAIDAVMVEVKKTSGTIEKVIVTLHATEALSESTVATGARLAAVDRDGAVVRTTTATPALDSDDPFTLQWTLTGAEWTALTDSASVTVAGTERIPAALSVAATNTLRASNWSSELPLLPPPDWIRATKPVFTSGELPVEVRESFTTLTAFVTGVSADATGTSRVYEVDSVALLAAGGAEELSDDIVSARMHAHPFTEPMTRLDFVRARWYDPSTGTFLTPDPLGYQDSSNLYAFAGGDPVNGRDPTGEMATVTPNGNIVVVSGAGGRYTISAAEARRDPVRVLRVLESDPDLSFADQERIMTEAGLPIPYSSACRAGESCIGSKQNNRAFTHMPRGGKWVEAAFIATSGFPPQTREQELMSGGLQVGTAVLGSAAVARGGITKKNTGRVSAEPMVPVFGGDLPVRIAGQIKYPTTPNTEMRSSAQGSYIDPLTNMTTYTNARLPVVGKNSVPTFHDDYDAE